MLEDSQTTLWQFHFFANEAVSCDRSINAPLKMLAVLGRVDEATELLQGLEQDERYVRPEFMAAAYGALGDLDRSFAVLEGALAVRSAGLIYLHVDPSYEPLRGDPRYVSLIERIGLITG